jgi:sensor histidine kinase YesM
MKMIFGRFKFRLLFTIIAAVLVCQIFGFFIIYRIVIRTIEDENERTTLESFLKVEASIDWVLESTLRFSYIIQTDKAFQAYLNSNYRTELEKRMLQVELALTIDSILSRYDLLNAIILFRDDGQIAGSSEPRRYFAYNPGHPFFDSKEFMFSVENPRTTTWTTGHLRFHFSQSEPYSGISDRDIIIGASRAVNTAYQPDAVLIVSVQESALRRLYGQLAREGSNIVLLNEKGMLFSGMDINDFGTIPDFFSHMQRPYGSFLWNNTEQVIYYKMMSTDWYIVQTIPVWVYKEGMHTALTGMIGVASIIMAILLVVITVPVFHFTKPIESLTNTMIFAGEGQLSLRAKEASNILEIQELSRAFNNMLDNIESLIHQVKEAEYEKTRLEVMALQNQLRPHFLYNTINAIRWMATFNGADSVADSLVTLIRLLRPVYNSNTPLWEIDKEFNYLGDYCSLMRLRYGKNVVLETCADMPTMLIPRFILQPLVENCFEHGLANREYLKISVTEETSGDIAKITVADDGIGILPDKAKELMGFLYAEDAVQHDRDVKGIGIINSYNRLRLIFGNDSLCEIEPNTLGGTTVTLKWVIKTKNS